ncbi:peptidase, S9A/B/C family, catalytic domain protein [Porphyromonas gingivalis F0185]|uniref:S9 family peptidase n=1 Tax=Porphyromonas gingivalis TaxID=837 RepID=UPI0003ACEE56|nr:S9 family peptidase [Porphyromonas gingivalis]ERJ83562.1 peptidase, S9A/B/C family, catalytic domain protein [Porphyromonas gingivalis F0185]
MKRPVIILLLGIVTMCAMAQTGNKPVDLKEITSGMFYARSAGRGIRSMPDGEHYTEMNRERTAIVRYNYASGKAVDTLFSVERARECPFKQIQNYEVSSTGHHILLFTDMESIYRHSYRAAVYDYDVRRNLVKPLSEHVGKVMIPTFSPDGRMVAFVRDNNIFIKKFDFDTEVQVTTDGQINSILNGATDWVYEEEFGVTNLMSWSADNAFLAFVRSDESAVPEYRMPMYEDKLYPEDYTYKYPKAGEKNSTVSLHLYNVADRNTKSVSLPIDADGYIPRIAFTDNADELAVMTLNRLQNDFKMYYVHPKSLVPKLILQDMNKRYVDSDWIQTLKFTTGGGFAYVSEKDGFAHIYLYDNKGVMHRRITSGNWDVTKLYGVDASGTVFYQSAEESPIRRAVYAIDAKGRKTKLSLNVGTNDALFSGNYAYYINTYSSAATPAVVSVFRSKGAKELRTLEDNVALRERLKAYRYNPKEFTTIKTQSGLELNAWIVKPIDFDPSRHYPVLMVQYSGPNSQQVLDRYSFDWEHYLASKGYVVACVDGRGTSARGEEWRKCTYMQLGVFESDDQIAAATAIGQLPYVDAARIGIWGWSYGGYTTLMSLCRGNGTFKAGIAVAPVADWRFYDSVYTERFMRTPKENASGYKMSSALDVASQLQGNLLIVSGSADDNVHLQNTMLFTEALVQANIPFDMAIYMDKNHSIYGGNTRYHLYTRKAKFLFDNL